MEIEEIFYANSPNGGNLAADYDSRLFPFTQRRRGYGELDYLMSIDYANAPLPLSGD